MSAVHVLRCVAPHPPERFEICTPPMPRPGRGQVLVQVEATSVNPIDAKRSTGYGRRLLALKGAAGFPITLGNDVAGTVQAVGQAGRPWRIGDRVFGLVPTGASGAHASHVLVNARHLRAAPDSCSASELATLPYTFTTLWLALKSLGLTPESARGKSVLVHGASGGLGQLALQTLSHWGAKVTAVCSTRHVQTCLDRGAHQVIDRTRHQLKHLPSTFDATLNFATWGDEDVLIRRLRRGALGHATTVHPLLDSMDRLGWWHGAWHVMRAWSGMRRLATTIGGSGTRYAWTIFRPDDQALNALQHLLKGPTGLHLPIGLQTSLAQAELAFDHVAQQRAGRAVLRPAWPSPENT